MRLKNTNDKDVVGFYCLIKIIIGIGLETC